MVSTEHIAPCSFCFDLHIIWIQRECLFQEINSVRIVLLFFKNETEANKGGAVGAVAGKNVFEGCAGFRVVFWGLVMNQRCGEGYSYGICVSGEG